MDESSTGIRILKSPRGQWGDLSFYHTLRGDFSDDPVEPTRARAIARIEGQRALREAVGSVIFDTTHLYSPETGGVGPVFGPGGNVLLWSMVFPHRKAVLDIFYRKVPSEAEQEFRLRWVTEQGFRYGAILPGYRASVEDIVSWLEGNSGESGSH